MAKIETVTIGKGDKAVVVNKCDLDNGVLSDELKALIKPKRKSTKKAK